MLKLFFISFVFVLLLGCATSYQSRGFSGGYSETQLDENVFKVSFIGNRYTKKERASDFALLRSSELALQYGYKYFDVLEVKSNTNNITFTTPTRPNTIDSVYGDKEYVSAYGHVESKDAEDKTFTYSGQTFNSSSPGFVYTIVCLKEKPLDAIPYNAESIYKIMAAKYGIRKKSN